MLDAGRAGGQAAPLPLTLERRGALYRAFVLSLSPKARGPHPAAEANMGGALSSGYRDIIPCLAPRGNGKPATKQTYSIPAFFSAKSYVNLETGASAMSRPRLGVSLKASFSARSCLRLPDASASLGQSAGRATRAGRTSLIFPTIIGASGGVEGKKTVLVEVIGTFFLSLALFKGFGTVLLALGCGLMLALGVWFGGGAYNPAVSVACTGRSILGKAAWSKCPPLAVPQLGSRAPSRRA